MHTSKAVVMRPSVSVAGPKRPVGLGFGRVSRRSQTMVSTTVRTTVKDSEQTEAASSTRPVRSAAYKAQFGIREKRTETETSEESSSSRDLSKMGEATRDAFDQFVNRYDFVSTAAGSMLVTTYCVMKGQCPATALMIAATATVTALVLNELMESSYYE